MPSPGRRSLRLRGFDYSQPGAYFVTICTRNRECVLGEVTDGVMHLSEAGQVVERAWQELPHHYTHARLDVWTIMPNHLHGIVVLVASDADDTGAGKGAIDARAGFKPAPTKGQEQRHGLPEIMRAFKTFSSRRINALVHLQGIPFWQRGNYEHVIRDEEALSRVRQYIVDNPARWHEDPENPVARVGKR